MPKRKKEDLHYLVEYVIDGCFEVLPQKKTKFEDSVFKGQHGRIWYDIYNLFEGSEEMCREKLLLVRAHPDKKRSLQEIEVTSKRRHLSSKSMLTPNQSLNVLTIEIPPPSQVPLSPAPTTPPRSLPSELSYSDFTEVCIHIHTIHTYF